MREVGQPRPITHYVGERFLTADGERGTITDVTHFGQLGVDPPRYRLRLDTGEDREVSHDDLDAETAGARARLERQFGESDDPASPIRAVSDRLTRAQYRADHETPSRTDLLDALTLIAGWRKLVDFTERHLIEGAREAGATWEQIGLVLGYTPAGAKQGASQRHKKLIARPAHEVTRPDGTRVITFSGSAAYESREGYTVTPVRGHDDPDGHGFVVTDRTTPANRGGQS